MCPKFETLSLISIDVVISHLHHYVDITLYLKREDLYRLSLLPCPHHVLRNSILFKLIKPR